MNTKIWFSILCAIVLYAVGAVSQVQKRSNIIPAAGIHTIVIECEGNCTIVTARASAISAEAQLTTSGKVYGIVIGRSPAFKLTTRQNGDTLHISTTPINQGGTIGISTYVETLDMVVSIPVSVTHVETEAGGNLVAELSREGIGSVVCEAQSELFVNGNEKNSDGRGYVLDGKGAQIMHLKGNCVHVVSK